MAIRHLALTWGAAFLLFAVVGFISRSGTKHPPAARRGQVLAVAAPVAAPAASRPAASSPSTLPATRPAARLKATVLSVKGLVQVRRTAGGPWQRCEVGMVLEEEAEFRTGTRGEVRFAIAPDRTVTIDRLGTCTLRRAVEESRRLPSNDDGGLRQGPIRYDNGTPRYDISPRGWVAGPVAEALYRG